MAKKTNPFTQDFQTIAQSADDAVFAFLKQGTQKEVAPLQLQPTNQTPAIEESKPENVINIETAGEKQERKVRIKTERSEKPEVPRQRPAPKVKEWGRPTALFNTRIPQEMAELLDDLVYKLRKSGEPKSKQDLAAEAIANLLATHQLI